MMMGYGNGVVGSSTSNLSALAPPFTVDRSLPKPASNPLVDLTEPPLSSYAAVPPLHNWPGSVSPPNPPRNDFFSVPNLEFDPTNGYGYSSSTAHHVPPSNTFGGSASTEATLYAPSPTGFVEASSYYPPFIPPVFGAAAVPQQSGYDLLSTSYATTSSGSSTDVYPQSTENSVHWGGFWEGLTDWQQSSQVPFDAKENYMHQGFYSSNCMSKYDIAPNGIDAVSEENHIGSAPIGQVEYKSFLSESSKLVPAEYPLPSSTPTSVIPVTFPHELSLNAVNYRKPQIQLGAPYGKGSGKTDSTPNGSMPGMKSSPAVVIRVPEQNHVSLLENINAGSDIDDNLIHSNPYIMKEDHPYTSFGGKGCFDARQVKFHLEHSEEQPSNKDVSRDTLDQFYGPGTQAHFSILDGFNLAVDNSDAINCLENCSTSNSFDHYNPAVDSPCWKGAPNSHRSPFKVSEGVATQDMNNVEVINDYNHQDFQSLPFTTSNTLNVSSEKPCANLVQNDGGILENVLGPLKRPSVANVVSREETNALKSGPSSAPSCSHRPQIPADIHELQQGSSLCSKLINNFDLESSHTKSEYPEDGKCVSKSACTKVNDIVDDGLNLNDDSDDCSSHVPFHAVENVLSSPPSVENASKFLNKSHCGESSPKISVSTLVNMMHNLSELLLFSCSNDKSALKKEDLQTVEDVINNLDMCMGKNVERKTSVPESFILHEANSELFGKSSGIQKAANGSWLQVPRENAVNYKSPHKYQHNLLEEEHNSVSGKKDATLSDLSAKDAAEIGEDDSMTQAIKDVLAQHFHGGEEMHPQILLYKNLWLEAEASFCSVNYKARFNRMKIEMEKYNSQKANVLSSTATATSNQSSSDAKTSSIQDIPTISTRSHPDDVMTRLQILKDRNHNSSFVSTPAVEKLSTPEVSLDQNMDGLGSELKSGIKPVASLQNSCMPVVTSQADDATSGILNLNGSMNWEKPDFSTQDFKMPITTSQADDFTTLMLKSCFDKSSSKCTSSVQKSSLKDSPNLGNVKKLAQEVEDDVKKNIFTKDLSIKAPTTQADDISARLQILKSRIDNPDFVNTTAMEKLSTSKVPSNLLNVDKLECEANDRSKLSLSIQDSPMSRMTSQGDNIETSVMARYQILKHRVENSSPMYRKKNLSECADVGYAGDLRRQCSNSKGVDRVLDLNVEEPLMQSQAPSSNTQKSTVKEFHLFVKDDPMTQSGMNDRMGDQPREGWYDNCSSDWEHVLKEELAGQTFEP